jgi:hypothetical protein
MKKLLITTACVALAAPSFVSAQSRDGGRNTDTTGFCISEVFLGNEPNQADGGVGGPSQQERGGNARGGVVPSQSPGPKVTNPDGTVRDGASPGDANRFLRENEIARNAAQVCQELGFGPQRSVLDRGAR